MNNEELLDQYIRELQIKENIANSSAKKWKSVVKAWLDEMDVTNLSLVDLHNALHRFRSKNYKQNTQGTMIYHLKRFLLWLVKKGIVQIPESEIREIAVPSKNRMTVTASMVLTREEVQKIINAGRTTRDRALIAMIFEGGLRPSEALDLTWGDIVDRQERGLVINTAKKTGKPRYVTLLGVTEYIAAWKADYQGYAFPEGDAPIFIGFLRPHKRIGITAVEHIMQKARDVAGIKKKAYPYLLRHSRITEMLIDNVPESAIKMQHWGSLSSNMLATYGHLTGKQAGDLILETYGLRPADKKKERYQKIKCERCFYLNSEGADYCMKCGSALTDEARERVKGIVREVEQSKEYLELKGEIEQLKKAMSQRRRIKRG